MCYKRIFIFGLLFASLFVFGCSNSGERQTESTNIEVEDTVPDNVEEIEECEATYYQLVFAKHFTGQKDDNNRDIEFDCFVFKRGDSFVKFENKASYEVLADMAAFPIVVMKEYNYERARRAEFASIKENDLKKKLPEAMEVYRETGGDVDVSDPINHLIEFAYYNNHPDNWTIRLEKEDYNFKKYKASPIKGWTPNLIFKPLSPQDESVTIEGETISMPSTEKIITVYGEKVPVGSVYVDFM